MIKIAAVYGAAAGSIVIASILVGFLLGADHGAGSLALGYAIMIVALTMIFMGVKGYRDRTLGGVIKFGPAFGLGLMIAVVSGLFYVVGWEIYLAATDYSFMPAYVEQAIAQKKAAGLAGPALETAVAGLEKMAENYKNPAFRVGVTFMEIFPVGVAVALVSAALLSNPRIFPARAAA
jgi:hypothetical protein